jgi:DNA-binding NarL/FixJ family response regulator
MAIRVVLVDDHQILLDGLRGLLAIDSLIEVVGEATNGQDGIDLAGRLSPDVVVLDVTMPVVNGIQVVRPIRSRSPATQVLGLLMHSEAQVASDMLRAGARGYMVKTDSIRELATAIKTVTAGQRYLSKEIEEQLRGELLRRESEHQESNKLTERERMVLKLLAEGKTSRQIAIALFVTTRTVVWHRQSIMRKLNLRSVPELTKYAVRMGMTTM